jgi:hypothetical protein
MKRRHAVLLAVLAGTLGWIGCDRAAPTEPDRSLAEMRPEKVAEPQPAMQLAGSWKGTISFYPFQHGLAGFTCSGPAPISVVLEQSASHLTGQFWGGGCAGALTMRVVVAGSVISGSLDTSDGTLGRISGTVSPSTIAFQTKFLVVPDDNEPNNKGQGQPRQFRTSDVVLEHENSRARSVPLLAGGGRSTRVLPPRR